MKKIILIIPVLFLALHVYSQKVIKKISKETCDCVGKIDLNADSAELSKVSGECIANAILMNLSGLKKELNIDLTNPESMANITDPLTAELLSSCPSFVKVASRLSTQNQPEVERGNTSNCRDFHLGKFRMAAGYGDTTNFIVFEGDMVNEYSSKGELRSKGKCKWINDCTYTNTFVESKDPSVQKMFKKGDVMKFEIINIVGNVISYEGEFKGNKFTYKIVKVQ